MTWPFENDTSAMIRKLAGKSLRSAKMKTIFSLVAITLSVGLMTGIILFERGVQTAEQRSFQTRQHVLYEQVTEQQARNIETDPRVSDSVIYKQGSYTLEVDDYLLALSYSAQDAREMETIQIIEGAYPTGLYDVAVDKAYLSELGLQAELGQQITVDWLDGTQETYTVTGLTEIPDMDSSGFYTLYVSEEYARIGSQLRDVPWNVAVRLYDADQLNVSDFREKIRTLGADYGLDITQVNEFNNYVDSKTLSRSGVILSFVVGISILFISVLVIYNIFYISVANRIRQFGQLRALGATVRQIRCMVRREGTILCFIGAPIGLVIGGAVAFCLQPGGWSWINVLKTAVVVWSVDYITVQMSLRTPAKMASAVSPIDALRGGSGITFRKQRKNRKLHRKLTPMRLAGMGIVRNKKAAVVTIFSLGISGILFMVGFTILNSVSPESYARQGAMFFGEVEICFSSNAEQQNRGGSNGLKLTSPMDDIFEQRLLEIEGVESIKRFSAFDVQFSYKGVNTQDTVRLLNREDWERVMKYAKGEKLSYNDAVSQKKMVLLHEELDEELFGWNFEVGDSLELSWYNGTDMELDCFLIGTSIDQKISQDESCYDLITQSGFFLMPEELGEAMMPSGFNFTDTIVVKTDYEKLGNVPTKQITDFVDNYPTLRYYTLEESIRSGQSIFQTLYMTILGLCLFVTGFSLMNLVNTMLTGIISRKQEFVMLRSVGMSRRQLSAAIRYEELIYSFFNVIITVLVGIPVGWLVIHMLKRTGAFYFQWTFPGWYFMGYALLTSLLPLAIAQFGAHVVQGDTLAEQLRTIE